MEDSTEDYDEFAQTAKPSSTSNIPVAATVEIISSVYEASKTRTQQEVEEHLLWSVGDLPAKDRKQRALQEACWTTQKTQLREFYIQPPPPPPQGGFLILGTNGDSCFALLTTQALLAAYLRGQQLLEQRSAVAAWTARMKSARLRSEAISLRTYLTALSHKDHVLGEAATPCIAQLDTLIPTLPEVSDEEQTPPIPGPRPGEVDPRVMLYKILPPHTPPPPSPPAGGVEGGTFQLWACNTTDRKNTWQACRCPSIVTKARTLPCVAFNKTHLAVLFHAQQGDGDFTLQLYELTSFGRPQRKPSKEWPIHLSRVEHFVPAPGRVSMSMSDAGVIRIACSNGVYVKDIGNAEMDHAIILHLPEAERRFHRIVSSAAHQLGEDCILVATSFGECFELDWRATKGKELVTDLELVLACEPIYSAYLSNRRLLLQTVLGMTGRLIPYHSPDFFYMPAGRVLSSAICGTLIFVLDKHGSILVYSALARSVIHPFAEPEGYVAPMWRKGRTTKAPGATDDGRPESETCEPDYVPLAASGIAYQAMSVSTERLVVAYPSGLIRVVAIKPKVARKIAFAK